MNVPLAAKHTGMRVNGLRILRQTRGQGYSYMRQQMATHLEELAHRFYAGDVSATDEFLQLYSIGERERSVLVEAQEKEGKA